MDGEQRPGWYFAHAQNDLHMFEGTVSLDMAQMCIISLQLSSNQTIPKTVNEAIIHSRKNSICAGAQHFLPDCAQQRIKSACASSQADHSLRSLPEDAMDCIYLQNALQILAGWSES